MRTFPVSFDGALQGLLDQFQKEASIPSLLIEEEFLTERFENVLVIGGFPLCRHCAEFDG